jgi:hypothetical protein
VAAQSNNLVSGHDRKRNVRRTALWLALLAAAFYFGFIAMGIWRSVT